MDSSVSNDKEGSQGTQGTHNNDGEPSEAEHSEAEPSEAEPREVEPTPPPDAVAMEEVESVTGTGTDLTNNEEIQFVIVEGSSQRQCPKLIDSRGYAYTKYHTNKNGSMTWRCRLRNKTTFCGTTVKQIGDKFILSNKEHCHPSRPGEHLTSQVISQVKRKATEHLFEPTDHIVSEVLIENLSCGSPVTGMPNPKSLARSANRLRRRQVPKNPNDLVFDMRTDDPPPDGDQMSDAGSPFEENQGSPDMPEEAAEVSNPVEPYSQLGTKFDTFEEVEQFMREHEKANFVKFFRMNSRTVESLRKRLPTRFLSDHLRYATVVFACIHHGKHKTTSKGLRPKQKSLRIGCPAKFRFSATTDGKQLYLSEAVTQHSHPHNEESFRSLPQKRHLTDTEREEACHILQKKGKKSAQKLFKEKTGKVLTMRDLHNLAAESKQQSQCFVNIQAILDYLSEAEDQSSIVEVVTKADGRIVGIFFQDQEMKRVYSSYPQYLVVDATCKYNSLRMPIYVLLMEDANGDSEIVSLFLVISSNTDSIRSMVLRFKEHNPAWGDVRVIKADKDFAERQLLQDEFPKASVQICLSHILRRFKCDLSKPRLGLQTEQVTHCLKLMQKLAASKSETAYMEQFERLKNTGLKSVIEYYFTTWHSNRQEWVDYLKSKSLALKREAPDKLDSVNLLLKGVFKNSPTAQEVMANLKKVGELLREERDHTAAALLVRDPPQSDPQNSVVCQFEQYVTPFALKYILRQLKLSWKVQVKTSLNRNSSSVNSSTGKLVVFLDSCPCRFWQSLCLPCRHIFAVRRIKGLPLFDKETIGSRWTMEHYKSSCRFSAQEAPSCLDAARIKRLALLSRPEKHSHISEITTELATVVSEAPVERFSDQVEAVKRLVSLFRSGSTVLISELREVHEDDETMAVGGADTREETTPEQPEVGTVPEEQPQDT